MMARPLSSSLLLAFAPLLAAAAPVASSAPLTIAIMDLRATSLAEGLGETLTGIVSEELDALRAFRTVSRQDIAQLLQYEKLKDLAGCTEVSCLTELGGALGADLVLAGAVTLLGDVYLIQLQLIDIARGRVEKRLSREYQGDTLGLTRDLRAATGLLVRDLLAQRSGRLLLVAREEGVAVKVDQQTVGYTPLPEPLTLAEGPHSILAEKEGFVRFARDLVVARDETVSLELALMPSPEVRAAYDGRVTRFRVAGFVLAGLGAAGLVGALLAHRAADAEATSYRRAYDRDPFAEELNDQYSRLVDLDAATVGGGLLGGLALVTGGLLLALGPDPDRYPRPAAAQAAGPSLRLMPVRGGALVVGGVTLPE